MAYWTPKDYTPFFLYDEPTHTIPEIRAEYSRIRAILMKRANRLEAAGFSIQAGFIRENMPKLKDITSHQELTDRLAQANVIMHKPSFSLKGIKRLKDEVDEATGENIPLDEVLDFHEYMKSWRTSAFRHVVDTNTAVKLYYTEYQYIGGTFDNFYTIFQYIKNGNKR